MTTQFDCALDGVLLSSLDPCICVLDVQEDAPTLRTAALARYPDGQRLLHQQRESLTVQVIFAIHEEDPTRRREVLRAIHAWAARGGLMTTADRPGQQLAVICTGYPAASAQDWTEKLTLTFTSARDPYWEDAEVTSVVGITEMTLTTPGTAEYAPVDVLVCNTTEETITTLTLSCGETQMTFDGIELPVGDVLLLFQSGGTVIAKISGKSVLACRTADSADRLLAPCGTSCTVCAAAGQTLQANFSVRGRYV